MEIYALIEYSQHLREWQHGQDAEHRKNKIESVTESERLPNAFDRSRIGEGLLNNFGIVDRSFNLVGHVFETDGQSSMDRDWVWDFI